MKKQKAIKIALLVIVLIFLIIRGIPYLVNIYLNANAGRIVSDMITRTPDFGGHDVHFGEIRINYNYQGTFLHLSDVKISPGSAITGKDKINFNLSLDQARLTGFSWIDFFFNNSISLDSALIENMWVESTSPPLDSLALAEKEPAENKRDYEAISVDDIRVNKVSFENRDSYSDSTRLSITDLFVFGSDFVLSREDLENPQALFRVGKIEGYLAQAAVHTNEYRNVFFARDLSFDTAEGNLDIGQLLMDNKLKPYPYSAQFEMETDWIELKRGNVSLKGMDFQAYFREGAVKADKLSIAGWELVIFRDKRKPEDMKRRPKKIFELVRDLPLLLAIKEVEISDGFVSYEERPETEAPRSGRIFFDGINASITGLTNAAEDLKENDEMILNAKGRLMGKGPIDLKISYFLQDSTGKFLMDGSMGSIDLVALNEIVEPATKVSLKSGRVNSLFFDITANGVEGTGEVIVKYEDLEIEILDKDFGHDQNIFQRIASFLANKIIIKSENPDKNGELKKGEVYYLRDQHKFIFKFWWELLLSGLKSTLTGDTEEELRKKAQRKD